VNGDCSDAEGVALCVCDEGWAGAKCDACAGGYHEDGEGGCVKDTECTVTTCSGHGECAVVEGVPTCTCAISYAGPNCGVCADGYQDNDIDGLCLPACMATSNCGHGQCSDVSGVALCQCETGWDGAACDECAPGYHDEDGACVADTGCTDTTCGGHGTCDASTGDPVCTCDTGYTGSFCQDCAENYQDNDGDNTCNPDCEEANLGCLSTSGACSDESGTAVCVCNVGYDGERCELCANGYQDNDTNGSCTPTCEGAALTCVHGACSDASGPAACACEAGYAGVTCDVCAAGYQDKDEDGVCAADCETANLGCVHGTCSDESGAAVCACETGYASELCDECAAGYHEDVNGACVQDSECLESTCNGHGACDASSGVPVCTCNENWEAPNCAVCVAGTQDNDNNGTCTAACSEAMACGHGACSDLSGTAACVCETGWTGATCAACAPGYHTSNGDCVQDTECTASTCNSHGVCSAASGTPVCTCATGYAGDHCELCADGYQDNDHNGSCTATCETSTLNCGVNGT